MCGEQCSTGTGSCPSTSFSPCRYQSQRYSMLIHSLPPTLHRVFRDITATFQDHVPQAIWSRKSNMFQIKHQQMHKLNIDATLLTLCHSDMFQPSEGHLQPVRQIHFNSKVNKISYQMQNTASQIKHEVTQC